MKKLLLASVLALVTIGSAMASDPTKSDRQGFYVGGSVNKTTDTKNQIGGSVDLGYQVNQYLRAELDYTHMFNTNGAGNLLMGNGIAQYRIPNSTVTPYGFGGMGVAYNTAGALRNGGAITVYNVGAGSRIAVSESVEVDARYTNVRPFQTNGASFNQAHLMTLGLNYRF